MKNIKMIVTDLDNTLLRNDKTVSEYTLRIIHACKERGIKFVPATARAIRRLKELQLFEILPYDALICLNGSQIFMNHEIIYHQGISKEEFAPVLLKILQNFSNQRISIEANDVMYVNHHIWEVDSKEKNYVITKDFSCLPDQLIDKIVIESKDKKDMKLIQSILPPYLYAHSVSDAPVYRILHQNVKKSLGIEHLCQLWQIHPDEVVCFGDDFNDLEMMEYCGCGIAMENAVAEVKERAKDITLSNEEDGVAWWLEKHLLSINEA